MSAKVVEGKVKVGNSDEDSEEEQTHHIHRPGEVGKKNCTFMSTLRSHL